MTIRKIITLSFLTLCLISLKAQTKDSVATLKKSVDYLPKAGEFGIGIDATPIFNYVGNFFNQTSNNKLDFSSPVLYGKYYLTDNEALRAVLMVSSTNQNDVSYVRDDAAWFLNPQSNKQVTDANKLSDQQYFVSIGYQKFTGETRIRGFYGAQILGGYNYSKNTYTYGNPMSEINPTPSSIYAYNGNKDRLLQSINTNSFHIGLGGIAGFEYYILPKVCIGGELSLNLVYTKGNQLSTKSEQVIGDQVVKIDKAVSPGSSDLTIKTSRFTPNGYEEHLGFYVMFHF
ncbi:MAG: hypothetical protein Q8904_13310 [Bacteroidota bacterium]|nr:hypothetical protein [Bacteroidota bacterium]